MRSAGSDGPACSASVLRLASVLTIAVACATSARKSGGWRVGMKSASSTPASVACRPLSWTKNQSATPSSV